MNDADLRPPSTPGGGLTRKQSLAIVSLFWLYVALSNVLYAYSMSIGMSRVTDVPLFADWNARVLQHVFLLPVLLVSFWASLRVQWRPLLVAVPLQVVLGIVFAALAFPALMVSELALHGKEWHQHVMTPTKAPVYLDHGFLSLWTASLVSFIPAYGFGLALVTGLQLYARFRDSELRVEALERAWTTARLAALRMQLSPHTLFNLLHSIRGHIEWDPKAAQAMVVQLADLLRRLLSAGEREFTRLPDELQFVRLYLELQQRRFADRLSLELPTPDEIPAVWVPSLILQPLVENAVLHGLAGHQAAVTVRIAVKSADSFVILRVSNTVAGTAEAAVGGIGIKNVRERLAVQFEGRARLTAVVVGSEWVSEITLPMLNDAPERLAARPAARLAT